MVRNFASRLDRLEDAIKPARRQFFVWGVAEGKDIEAEKQRLRDQHGPIQEDEFVVFSWLAPQT
jgi:hypothetical protein